jgi:hypothetical protein
MLPQGISLEAEQSRKRKKQHHARDQHDHERDFLPDRAITQVSHGLVQNLSCIE